MAGGWAVCLRTDPCCNRFTRAATVLKGTPVSRGPKVRKESGAPLSARAATGRSIRTSFAPLVAIRLALAKTGRNWSEAHSRFFRSFRTPSSAVARRRLGSRNSRLPTHSNFRTVCPLGLSRPALGRSSVAEFRETLRPVLGRLPRHVLQRSTNLINF